MDPPSPDNFEDSPDLAQGGIWETPRTLETPDPTEQTSPTIESNEQPTPNAKPTPVNLPKRRRVTRACDECRRKKIKCDGKQPCTHCTVYSYECTYDQPSNRRRNAAPQYIEALENQLKRAKALLSAVLPNVDLTDPDIEARLQNGTLSKAPAKTEEASKAGPAPAASEKTGHEVNDQLESMVNATGQLDLDEQGYWDYHGHSSGLSFIRRMREQFGDLLVAEGQATPFVKSRPMSVVFDSPKSAYESPKDNHLPFMSGDAQDLPSKEVALRLCDNAINDASALLRVVHEPTFYKNVDRIYNTPAENHGNQERSFLPLLYAVLALGSLFSKDHHELESKGYENAIDEGFKYFRASRQLMDIADCRDLSSLQAIIFMIQFLQSSAKLSTCYSYIGVALRSALRQGLHRSFSGDFNPIEYETRKRIFWVIRKMDTYVGALLGLPHTLSDDDIDQEYPAEVDDEYITETGILPMPAGRISVMAASNAHTNIVYILGKIVRYIYPIKSAHPRTQTKNMHSYTVSYAKIREIEKDLQDWLDQLPMGLKPGGDAPPIIIRVQQLLRMAYAHAQMMLYRPFLHYVSQTCKSKAVDPRAFACASACVSVSRNIIHITAEMKRQRLLIGAYWFTMYTTFFAILSLVFFALENLDNPTSQDILRDACEGRETLAQLAKRSMAADRCTATLRILFDQLPERIQRGREKLANSNKRRQDQSSNELPPKPSTSSSMQGPDGNSQLPKRASTFPNISSESKQRASFPLPGGNNKQEKNLAAFEGTFHGSPAVPPYDFSETPTPSSTTPLSLNTMQPITTPNVSQGSFPQTPLTQAFNIPIDGFPNHNATNAFNQMPDMSAMMFPSADPFAYPNQPMTTFENATNFNQHHNQHQQQHTQSTTFNTPLHTAALDDTNAPSRSTPGSARNSGVFSGGGSGNFGGSGGFGSGGSASGSPAVPSANVGTPQSGVDLDVQLFGPVPMYMMQGQQFGHAAVGNSSSAASSTTRTNTNGFAGAAHAGASMARGGGGPFGGPPLGGGGGAHDQLASGMEDLFGSEEWAGGLFMDAGMGMGHGGFGGMGGGGATGMGLGDVLGGMGGGGFGRGGG